MVYQLPEDDAITLALVIGLINFTIVYVVCAFVGCIKIIKLYVKTHKFKGITIVYFVHNCTMLSLHILNSDCGESNSEIPNQ